MQWTERSGCPSPRQAEDQRSHSLLREGVWIVHRIVAAPGRAVECHTPESFDRHPIRA